MKTSARHICNLFLVAILITSDIEARIFRTRRRINFDDLSKEDLDKFLENIVSRRENNAAVKQKSCVPNFEEESGVILRTRDSILNGAEFIEAPKSVETAYECKQECCDAVSEKSGRHCDLAVLQYHENDRGETQPKCFLFSCTKNEKNVCMTSINADYKIFRLKNELVEKQLIDIASKDLPSISSVIDAETENKHGECSKQFVKQKGVIIRTHDSVKNGAEFLDAPEDIATVEKCQSQCCITASEKSSRHCDFAVFQQIDDDPKDDQPKCYLFSCNDENGKFNCITSLNNDYVVLNRTIDIEEDELFDVINSSTLKPTTELATTTTPLSTSQKATTTSTSTSTSTTTTTATTTLPQTPATKQICTRLEWQCDDGRCIKVTEVCNGKVECKDSSDENGCDALEPQSEKKELLSLATTTLGSTTIIKTNEAAPSTKYFESSVKTVTILPTPDAVSNQKLIQENDNFEDIAVERTEPQKGAVLPLALGLSVTACVLFMVACRFHIMKKKLRRRGKPLAMEESDYLINGMYL